MNVKEIEGKISTGHRKLSVNPKECELINETSKRNSKFRLRRPSNCLHITPYLENTPSSITTEDFVYLIEMKIQIMTESFNKITMQYENLEYAEKIHQLNNNLDLLSCRKASKLEYAEAIDEAQAVLDHYKYKAVEELNYKKQLIKSRAPIDVKQIALNDAEQKIKITSYNRDNFLEHLTREKQKLTNIKVNAEITEKINGLKYTYDRYINNLKKNYKDLKLKTHHVEILSSDLRKLDKSLEEIENQHKEATAKLTIRRLKAHLPKETAKLRPRTPASSTGPNNTATDIMLRDSDISDYPENAKVRRLTEEIQRVDLNIETVNKITYEAIADLENQKRSVKKNADPNAIQKTSEELDKDISEITGQHDTIIDELTGKQTQIKLRKQSIDVLDNQITRMDREIARIQAQRDEAVAELQRKKMLLQHKLGSVERLDQLISILTYRIYTAQHDFRKDMDDMQRQREELLRRNDLTESQMALALAELDIKIADVNNMHEAAMVSLNGQRDELERESLLQMSNLDDKITASRKRHEDMLAELEASKIGATPSQIELINKRIAELNGQFEQDLGELLKVQAELWEHRTPEEKLAALLDARGLRLTPSGRFLTGSGRLLTRDEAECLGLLDGINASLEDLLKYKPESTKSSVSQVSSSVSSCESKLLSPDVLFLKEILGKPLTLALAEITAKQPRDPIHYLAHWLFKYRYNQEVDVVRKQEIEELIEERERIAKEIWHQQLMEEARAAVVAMIIRAEQECMRREMEAEVRRIAMLEANEELESEARDTLGIYNGPKTGQRTNM